MVKSSGRGTIESYRKMSDGVAAAAAQSGLSFIDTHDIIKPENQQVADIITRFKSTGRISDDERRVLDQFNYGYKT